MQVGVFINLYSNTSWIIIIITKLVKNKVPRLGWNDFSFRPKKMDVNKRNEVKTIFEEHEKDFCSRQSILNCAVQENSGFWFNSCSAVNLNGRIFRTRDATHSRVKYTDGMIWATWHPEYYSLMFSNILIRPVKR